MSAELSPPSELLDRLLRASGTIAFAELGPDGVITRANGAFAERFGLSATETAGLAPDEFLTAPDARQLNRWLGDEAPPAEPVRLNFATPESSPFTLRCLLERSDGRLRLVGEPEPDDARTAEELMRLNNELATLARERIRRERELERTRRELEEAMDELQTSYWHLQKIQEVLPVCVGCGRVKTDELRWQSVVEYLRDNDIFLSHGYCPSCLDAFMEKHGLEAEEPS